MSYPFKPFPIPGSTPGGKRFAGLVGLSLAAAFCAAIPAAAEDSYAYGHAEVTIGFPNGHVTLGKTWETGDADYDDEDDGYEIEKRVIIRDESRCEPKREVVIVRPEPVRCDPPRRIVIVEREPVRCDPPRKVVIVGGYQGHRRSNGGWHHGNHWNGHRGDNGHRGRNGGHVDNGHNRGDGKTGGHGYGHNRGNGGRGGQGVDSMRHHGPRDLFGKPSDRPSRDRGVQKRVAFVER